MSSPHPGAHPGHPAPPPPRAAPAPRARQRLGLWALAVGLLTVVLAGGYGAFLIAFAQTGYSGGFYEQVRSTPVLEWLASSAIWLQAVGFVPALIAVVLGGIAVSRDDDRGAGIVAVVLGALAPWVPVVGFVQMLMASFSWT